MIIIVLSRLFDAPPSKGRSIVRRLVPWRHLHRPGQNHRSLLNPVYVVYLLQAGTGRQQLLRRNGFGGSALMAHGVRMEGLRVRMVAAAETGLILDLRARNQFNEIQRQGKVAEIGIRANIQTCKNEKKCQPY